MLIAINIGSVLASAGSFLLKLFLLFFVLGIIILVHEFGHFIWAKKFGVHIYEFSIGMGPLIHTHKGKKDKIDYNFRALPIGGYVSMAGEVYDDDDKVPKNKLLCNKPWYQRLIIMVAGVVNNFILAILLLIIYVSIWGGQPIKPVVTTIIPNTSAETEGLKVGDTITAINGQKVHSWDKAQIVLYYKHNSDTYDFEVKHKDGKKETIKLQKTEVEVEGEKQEIFGFQVGMYKSKNILKNIGYGFARTWSLTDSFLSTLGGLITGKISIKNLSGPVGMYQIVGESVGLKIGDAINYLVYLVAYLCINVGFINILPFPAFDGGHVLFLLLEKILGKPIDSKIENTVHLIGFILIFGLMIIVTIGDIIKLF